MLNSKVDALTLMSNLGASEHLLTHVKLVGEAADLILDKCKQLGVPIDSEFVKIGVAIHDIGKITHAQEMTAPGSEHEPEGERILLSEGVSPKIARCCMSHARWHEMDCSTEELLIALADKLWKGKRVESLELHVIDRIAATLAKERWDIYQELDTQFESIAADGNDRLNRSVSS
ncbi:phosphohydrolase [Shewanella colwelliana]|uniref:HD domain-containing protein n=1 Tax=Shewanella colwelliana TaxID=23 RepID=UPI001B7FD723|nr:HD domain-containing protein [Shewanella colwelliana]GIU27040.1 phosphohydrolase [Shewanella colwelliana]